MIQQIRTVSHNRLVNKTGLIADEEYKEKILDIIKLYFEF